MKKSIILVISMLFLTCSSSHKIFFKENQCNPVSKQIKNRFLELTQTKDDKYSALIFTTVYNDEKIRIANNNKEIYNAPMKELKTIRVERDSDIFITDITKDYSFTLTKEKLKKYKYVYIGKNPVVRDRYEIIYSNTFCTYRL